MAAVRANGRTSRLILVNCGRHAERRAKFAATCGFVTKISHLCLRRDFRGAEGKEREEEETGKGKNAVIALD